ncbi:MAG: hypothetical protein PHC66_02905 [Candidatus Nanoarchaeia archaeon]|nr:hypothetical protein [Candidatus Nanoarchaeia archaeon]MDD5239010.1 hypothetical protein [Candidatus Nanoarchaeia archaeon]
MAYNLKELTKKINGCTRSEKHLKPDESEDMQRAIKDYFAENITRLSKQEFEKITEVGSYHIDLKKLFISEYTENVVKPYIISQAEKRPGKNFHPAEFIKYLKIKELPFVAVARATSQLCNERDTDLVSVIELNSKKYYRYDPECAELMRGPIVRQKTSCRGAYCNTNRCPKNKPVPSQESAKVLPESQSCETLINS